MAECDIRLQPLLPSSVSRSPSAGFSPASSQTIPLAATWRVKFLCHDVTWKQIVHPDAGRYYISTEQNLCTWSNIADTRVRGLIMEAAQQLKTHSELQSCAEGDSDVYLVLDVKDCSSRTCLYYFASHVDQRIFWLAEHGEVKVERVSRQYRRNPSQSQNVLDQYWKHCELFPTTLPLTHDTINYLKDVLIQASGERMMLKYSTSPFTKDDLSYMLSLVKEIGDDKCLAAEGSSSGAAKDAIIRRSDHSAWVIANLMSLHVSGALRNFYGQSDDFFDIKYSETTPRPPYQRSWFLILLDVVLFRCADAYAEQLYTLHNHFSPESWFSFVHKVHMSIRDSNLLATVLLSSSVAALPIGGIDAATGSGERSAVQIIISTSIICSVGSIAVGLLMMQQYRAKGADTPLRAVTVLKRILKKPYGLERLAVACCLPAVLLIWSLLTFFVALSIVFYYQTSFAAQLPVTTALGLVVLALCGCLNTFDMWLLPLEVRSKDEEESATSLLSFVVQRLRSTSYGDR
ncbi:hypothetical protein EDD15DRAFT_1118414 [Pisolithus albus]|nr:hypothetical protein EDD15DRAFT_1118414 [Pisolithus albus]